MRVELVKPTCRFRFLVVTDLKHTVTAKDQKSLSKTRVVTDDR